MIHTFSGLIRSLELLEICGTRSAVASSSEMILNLDTHSFKGLHETLRQSRRWQRRVRSIIEQVCSWKNSGATNFVEIRKMISTNSLSRMMVKFEFNLKVLDR
jgi:hypothetical protein